LVYVTNWSLVHFVTGAVLVRLVPDISVWAAFWIHTLAETWQIVIGNTPWRTTRGQVDILVDTVFFMAGVYTR
jgi:hypothetical protein